MIAKDETVEMSLCVILPVRNAQDRIAGQVAELLEILPDLTQDFEILVVDDASTDHTEDVVQDQAQTFPQVRVIRHRVRKGTQAAVQTAMNMTRADIVFVHRANTRVSQARLSRLWELRNDSQLVLANAIPEPKPLPRRLLDSLVRWGMGVTEMDESSAETGGIQMIRRQALEGADSSGAAGQRDPGRINRTDQGPISLQGPQSTITGAHRLRGSTRQNS